MKMSNLKISHTIFGVLALAAMPAVALAASPTLSDLGLSQAQIRAIYAQIEAPVSAPGIAFGSPVGFGAGWGQAFIGIGGQTLPSVPGKEDMDGSASLGFGIGDPHRLVGLEVAATAISLRNNTGEDGNVNFKLHHALPNRAALAIGVENTNRWGAAQRTTSSVYFVGTKVFDLAPDSPENPVPLSINLGFGDGRFNEPGADGIGVFGSLAIAPFRQLSIIADWTGRDANAGLSLVPFRRFPFVITAGAINLGERYGNDVEFAGGIGYLLLF